MSEIKREPTEELVKRTDLESTPFTIIEVNGECFGALGKYRITEPSADFEVVKAELLEITWNRIVQVLGIMLESREQILNAVKEEIE